MVKNISKFIKKNFRSKHQWLKYLKLKMSAYPFEKERYVSEGANHDKDIWLNLDKNDD